MTINVLRLSMSNSVAVLALVTAVAGSTAACARTSIEGYWEPRDGSVQSPQKPVLTAQGEAARKAGFAAADMKDGVAAGSRYCLAESQPWTLYQSAPIAIVQDARETTMMFEHKTLPFHIFTDGRGHPADLKPTENGHAIGRWEGKTFVVDSVGFTDAAGPGLPNGVPKSSTLHVVMRLEASADGKELHGHFTADDRVNLTSPYSWDVTWYRSAPDTYAAVGLCDPRDLANARY